MQGEIKTTMFTLKPENTAMRCPHFGNRRGRIGGKGVGSWPSKPMDQRKEYFSRVRT